MVLTCVGNRLMDGGRVVTALGANRGGFNASPFGGWQREGYGRHDGGTQFNEDGCRYQMRVMRDVWGFTANRWTMNIENWLDNVANYRYNIRRSLEIANEEGIYVILCPWRVQNGTDWQNDPLPFPPYTHTGTTILASEQDFIDFWVSVATYLSDLPNWLIDPYNEPHMVTATSHDVDRAVWFDVVSRLIPAVRQICNNIVLVQWMEGAWWGGPHNQPKYWVYDFIAYLEARGANTNITISTHLYSDHWTFMGWGGPRPNTKAQLLADYTRCGLTSAGIDINYPLIIGETGCDERFKDTGQWEDAKTWWRNSLSILNDWGVSYLAWNWAVNAAPQGSYNPFALLQNWDAVFVPPPTESGEILISAIRGDPLTHTLSIDSSPRGVPFTIKKVA